MGATTVPTVVNLDIIESCYLQHVQEKRASQGLRGITSAKLGHVAQTNDCDEGLRAYINTSFEGEWT